VFASMGKSGGCAASQSEGIARLISLALRSGVRVDSIVRELRGIRCPSPSWQNGGMVLSCADAMGIVLERQMKAFTSTHPRHDGDGMNGGGMNGDPPSAPQGGGYGEGFDSSGAGGINGRLTSSLDRLDLLTGACPECGSHMTHQSGCATCMFCGYSKCM